MKADIRFISAGAGTGKTHRLTEIVREALFNGDCRPAGLIATTFTVKAANELKERVRRALYDADRPLLAQGLAESLIGTVHSVCGQLLRRFAFEAGIAPTIEILGEEEERALLSRAVEMAAGREILTEIEPLYQRLGQLDLRSFAVLWKDQVRTVVSEARANDVGVELLPEMAERSAREYLTYLPAPATENVDSQLESALRRASTGIKASKDETKATQKYLQLC